MSLSPGDLAQMQVLAIEAAERIIERVIATHLKSCPIGKSLNVKIGVAVGFVGAVSLMSAVIGIISYFHEGS